MMTRWQFETALRTLVKLDMQELVDAGVIADRDYEAWDAFHADPVTWFLAHPSMADTVWRAVWRHQALGAKAEQSEPPANVVPLRKFGSGD